MAIRNILNKETLSKKIDNKYTKTSELKHSNFENEEAYYKAYKQASKFEEEQYKKRESPEEKAIEKIKNIKSDIKVKHHSETGAAEKTNLERELEKYYTEINKNKELASKIMNKNPNIGKEIKQMSEKIKKGKSISYSYRYF